MAAAKQSTVEAEAEVLRTFRKYGVRVSEMLFFNGSATKSAPVRLVRALASLVEQGMVIRERHPEAYSLTPRGYELSRTV